MIKAGKINASREQIADALMLLFYICHEGSCKTCKLRRHNPEGCLVDKIALLHVDEFKKELKAFIEGGMNNG